MDTNEPTKRRGRPRKEQPDPTLEEVLPQGGLPPKENPKAPAPAMDPHFGDFTPAWMEWFRENHTPAQWEERYGGRI